jgi:hypothetical protein
VSAEKLLPAMAAPPNHMASLLLTSSAATNTICDAPSEDLAVMRLINMPYFPGNLNFTRAFLR